MNLRSSLRTTVSAVAVSAALVAAPVVSLPSAAADPVPVAPDVATVELPDHDATTRLDVPDGAAVIGVSWTAEDPAAAPEVQVRAKRDGAWGDWVDVPPSDDGPDAGTVEAEQATAAGGVRATDPVDVMGAEQVEVRTSEVADVEDLAAAIVDPGESAADAVVGARPAASADASAPRPAIVTRAQWGADEKLRTCTPSVAPSLKGVIVHHTADTNTYSAAQGPAMVRSIYAYHTKVNKWCDVGYNALVDRYGQIYEGRFGGLDRNVIGAHAGGFNTGTWGVSVIGNFETAALPAAAQSSVEKLVAWRLGVARLNPLGTMTLTSAGSSKYKSGAVVKLPVVAAHRDVGLTACPGINYYNKLTGMRTTIGRLAAPPAPAPAPAPARSANAVSKRVSDFTGDKRTDVVATTPAGALWLYPGNGSGGWGTRSLIGSGWQNMRLTVTPGDVTGDGNADIYATDASGRLWLYPSNGKRGWKPRVQVGTGWQVMNALIALDDFDGDGRPDLGARDTAGRLWLYPTRADGSFAPRKQIGTGWQVFNTIIGTGDFDGDGKADVLGRYPDGRLMLYPGNGKGGWLTRRQVGSGWHVFDRVLSVGDFTGDGRADVLGRYPDGRLMLYPGNGKGGWQPQRQVGSGWNMFNRVL